MKYAIQQVYKNAKTGKQKHSSVCDDKGRWYDRIQEIEEPFTSIESAREAAAYLRYEADNVLHDGEDVEFKIVNVQTRTRYSEKVGK
jgi:hypothetical protein